MQAMKDEWHAINPLIALAGIYVKTGNYNKALHYLDTARDIAQNIKSTEHKAERVAHMAGGSWLKALEALKADSENEFFLDMFQTLMRMAYARRVKDMKTWSERMATAGREKQKRFLEYALRLVRENFMYNFGERDLCYMTEREEDFAKKFARYINEANVIEISDLITLAIRDIGQNANAKIVFFHLAIQMIVLLIQK